jgi:catechol 1,2-dioxygenase
MIIEKQEHVTRKVLEEMHRTPDARTKEILAALVTHLHAFVREVRLTEAEFQAAIGFINQIGQKTTPSHNEAMLLAGALGVSNLVCLLNNRHPAQANNLGPFFRDGAPRCENGARCCARRRPARRLSSRAGCATAPATRSPAPKSMYGTPRPSASTRTRTRARRT